ncbi:MAG: hypothetical protein IJK73_01030 [Bacteroidales bacterium]|nr:hypothetical protein [Bacteroidales bacterium]
MLATDGAPRYEKRWSQEDRQRQARVESTARRYQSNISLQQFRSGARQFDRDRQYSRNVYMGLNNG